MRDRAQQTDTPQLHQAEIHPAVQDVGATKVAGGAVPAVQAEAQGGVEKTASEVAYAEPAAAAPDANEEELKAKVGKLVDTQFGGDYKKGFDHYDADHDGGVGKDELTRLLEDAHVGNAFTRGAWVKGIIKKLDTNGDGKIEWPEFESVFK